MVLLYHNHRHLSGICTRNDCVYYGTFHNEGQIKAIAYRVQNKVTKDITIRLRGEYSFEALVDTYLYRLKVWGLSYEQVKEAENKNNRHTFIVRFDVGRKFSLSQAEFLKASFEPVVTVKIEYAITDKSVAITVKAGETWFDYYFLLRYTVHFVKKVVYSAFSISIAILKEGIVTSI